MKPQDLRILAELLLDLQEKLQKDHHHPISEDILDNRVVKAYAATVELVDFVSEEIAALEAAGVLEPLPADPEGDAIFDEAMKRIFDLDDSDLEEIHRRLQEDPELDELPERAGNKVREKVMAAIAESRVARWKDQPSEL